MRVIEKSLQGLTPTCSGWSRWCIGFLLLISAALYIYLAATQPRSAHEIIPISGRSIESNGLLYYLLEHLCQKVGFTSNIALRSISIASGLGAIALVYICGHLLSGARTGLICAWVLAINCTHLTLAVHNRFYALNELFCALATLLLLCAYAKNHWFLWLSYALTMVLCICTMVMSAALWFCHAIILLLLPWKRRSGLALLATGIISLAILGWLVVRDPQAYQRLNYSSCPPVHLIIEYWLHNHYAHAYQGLQLAVEHWSWSRSFVLNSAFALIIIFAARCSYKKKAEIPARTVAGLLLSLVIVLIMLIGYSQNVKNIVNSSNISWLLPGFALIIGWTLARYRLLLYYLALALLLNPLDCTGTYAFPASKDYEHNQHLARHMRTDDLVLLEASFSSYALSKLDPNLNLTALPAIKEAKRKATPPPEPQRGTIMICNYERIYRTLRSLRHDNSRQPGRIWLIYPHDGADGPNTSHLVNQLLSDKIKLPRYIISQSKDSKYLAFRTVIIAPADI